MRRLIFLLSFTIFTFCGNVYAVELIVYKDNLKTSKEGLYKLFNEKEELLNKREIFQSVRKKLPPTQIVEYQGLTIETENVWISQKLDEAEKDGEVFYQRLAEITERISAIETRIQELEIAVESNFSKQDNKQKLDDILNREEFKNLVKKERKVEEESWLQKQINEFLKWLDSLFPKNELIGEKDSGFQSLSIIIQLIVISLVILLLGLLIYKFAPFLAAKFQNREKKSKGTRIILGEKILADQNSTDLLDEAERLAGAGEMRLAIRKGYVALLCELSDRKLISLAQHKTNRDYLRDVKKHKSIFQNIHFLTGSFETHWYGFARADEKDWEEFKQLYKETLEYKKES